jgi:hypothetical protein
MAKRFQRIAPSLAGVDAAGVETFLDRVDAEVGGLHSVMMLRDGIPTSQISSIRCTR